MPSERVLMTLLLPDTDEIADAVAARLPGAAVVRYGQASREQLDQVTFYCLPYMGDSASISLVRDLPALAVVQSLSSGVDDVLGAVPGHVTLCNGHGLGHEEGTADLAVTLILASLRSIPYFAGQQSLRAWSHIRTESVDGKRILLVGYGTIGAAIEQRLAPFGARVSRVSRTARAGVSALTEIAGLAAAADVLVICIALTPATRGLVSAEVLAALPDGALVVNVARGPVVDAAALAGELRAGRLRAALDVTDVEPLPPDRAEWGLPGVLITPHIGGDTYTFARRAPAFVAGQAARHLSGEPLANVVGQPGESG
jgi:phosphoglycerate dehydrogenase-like enzyme